MSFVPMHAVRMAMASVNTRMDALKIRARFRSPMNRRHFIGHHTLPPKWKGI